jgi:hypothetical protein
MKHWLRLLVCVAVLFGVAAPPDSALGLSVSGRSSTEFEWYDTGDGETAVPFYQYMLFNVHD